LFGECVSIHCSDCSLVSAFRNKTHASSPDTHIMWLRNSSPSLCHHSKNPKPMPFCVLFAPVSIFGTHLAQNLWQSSLNVILLLRILHGTCGNLQESCEVPSFTNVLVNTLNKIITHYRYLAHHFALHCEQLFVCPSLNFPHHCLTVLSLFTG
jgi:hypothetical protein